MTRTFQLYRKPKGGSAYSVGDADSFDFFAATGPAIAGELASRVAATETWETGDIAVLVELHTDDPLVYVMPFKQQGVVFGDESAV
jgi:hypothetical protein